MKRLLTTGAFCLSLAATAFGADLTGYITCSSCKHTKGSEAECAKKCIKGGSTPVLVTSDGKTYKIANPSAVQEDKIGQKVTVTGTVEKNAVTIDSVKAA